MTVFRLCILSCITSINSSLYIWRTRILKIWKISLLLCNFAQKIKRHICLKFWRNYIYKMASQIMINLLFCWKRYCWKMGWIPVGATRGTWNAIYKVKIIQTIRSLRKRKMDSWIKSKEIKLIRLDEGLKWIH